jgi:Domain of unknown function (DUF5060)/Putative collagen-binding domain of a collagenase
MERQTCLTAALVILAVSGGVAQPPPSTKGVAISGELRQWHKVTLTLDGPQSAETASDPNPFRDYRMTVTFAHESGVPTYNVPGYFAADGNAANTSATAGNKWRAHASPDKTGRWDWRISFVRGKDAALDANAAGEAEALRPYDGLTGSFQVSATNKTAPDFRALGRLEYVGAHYLRFAGTGEYFLKVGPDSPETLLAYTDFDDTKTMKPAVPVRAYEPHVKDWVQGDPVWKDGKGKGLIGAINYLSSKKANSMSFIPYNAGGDGDNVWPFVSRDDKFHYDVSKLDQWQIVFDHAQRKGLYLHFKLQETENDDNVRGNVEGRGAGASEAARGAGRAGDGAPPDAGRGEGRGRVDPPQTGPVVESLDGGDLGPERRLYLRELIARFGYELALNWNLGEENTQSAEQQRAMSGYLLNVDPYRHHTVVHTFPNQQETVYSKLLGEQSVLTGASLQNSWSAVHERTLKWVTASRKAGKRWVVANDEQGSAGLGVPPDPGYRGFTGKDAQGNVIQSMHDIRKMTLWGNLMAGGAGVEYYFGYTLPDNDLVAENFRSRDKSWDYAGIALDFFRAQKIPFWAMTNADALVGNNANDNSRWCFAMAGDLYLVYLPAGGTTSLDLGQATGQFAVSWFDPRNGGPLKRGSVTTLKGGTSAALGNPPDNPSEDWLVVVRR